MSPRYRNIRKVADLPILKGFKPFGVTIEKPDSNPVILLIEEYEALRLCDYEGLNHHQASVFMGVSRPTFTRIYASALRKISAAFVEGRPISIEGGKVYFDSEWYHCADCDCYFNHPEKHIILHCCPLCKGQNFHSCYGNTEVSDIHSSEGEEVICFQCR